MGEERKEAEGGECERKRGEEGGRKEKSGRKWNERRQERCGAYIQAVHT